MLPLHRSILSTLALYAAESHPYLTLPELHGYLHKNPAEKDARTPTLREVAHGISELAQNGKIHAQNGFYALMGSPLLEEENHHAGKKLEQARFAIALLKSNPIASLILPSPFIRVPKRESLN